MKKPMTNGKTKLELTWIGKGNRPKLEPRILIEDPAKSYHAVHRGYSMLRAPQLAVGFTSVGTSLTIPLSPLCQ